MPSLPLAASPYAPNRTQNTLATSAVAQVTVVTIVLLAVRFWTNRFSGKDKKDAMDRLWDDIKKSEPGRAVMDRLQETRRGLKPHTNSVRSMLSTVIPSFLKDSGSTSSSTTTSKNNTSSSTEGESNVQ